MSFRDHLESVCQKVPGAVACSVMGFDGIAIDTATGQINVDIDLDTLLVEFSGVIGNLRATSDSLAIGELEEMIVRAENVVVVLRLLAGEYFTALALLPDALVGKGRFFLRLAARNLEQELV